MSSIGNRIIVHNVECNDEIIERLKKIPVSNIGDVMNRIQGVDPVIRCLNGNPIAGRALTVKTASGDNLFVHKAISDHFFAGAVLVVKESGSSNRALAGELMISQSITKGFTGMVIDGWLRDSDYVTGLKGFGVYGKGFSLNGPYKNGPGEIGTDIAVGGQVVRTGDYIRGDGDGIVIIPQQHILEVLAESEKVMENEKEKKKQIAAGKYEKPWMYQMMEKLKTVIRAE